MTLNVSTANVRLGIVLEPNGSPLETEGVLNPGITRDRSGNLLMYPRMVAAGNVSRIGLVACSETDGALHCERRGFALEPEQPHEMSSTNDWHGCEDPRVTFVPLLDKYVMAYTAFGEGMARIALAVSDDAYFWKRLGLVHFADENLNARDNKDAALFPAPVHSPQGIESFALYHRPMLPGTVRGQTPIELIRSVEPQMRESTCLAYVPVTAVLSDLQNLCFATESVTALNVSPAWGAIKNGAGTPPVRVEHGWLSFFHAVDVAEQNGLLKLVYRAGIVVHDPESPHIVRYRSPAPILGPVTLEERFGTVDDVVFPTGIDPQGNGAYDIYYGAADARIGRARFTVAIDAASLDQKLVSGPTM